jgi:hypothetical protein
VSFVVLKLYLDSTSRQFNLRTGRSLSFHETVRPMRVASAAQVRQPIYNGAIGRWRAYETFLDPLLTELGAVTPVTP